MGYMSEVAEPTIDSKPNYTKPLITIGALFFIFGFITWINGTLIPYLKISCQLKTEFESYLVATAFFIAFTVMAIPSSLVLKKIGYKNGMSTGLLIMAVGALLFIPAASSRNYNLFLVGLFVIGTGLALLQTASNPYVSIIGPIESAATRISIMGICNKIGGILAGVIFGYIALKDADVLEAKLKLMDAATKEATLSELSSRVIIPYLILSLLLIGLAVAIYKSELPDINDGGSEEEEASNSSKSSALQFPHLMIGVLALFVYVGAEVIAGDIIISYGKSLGIGLETSRYFTQGTLAFMLLGYVVGIFTIPKYITQAKALAISAILGAVCTVLAMLTSGYTSVAFVALLGLANSIMWPAIFPLAINGLGKYTKTGSAFLIMAISGGAILPLIYGKMIELFNQSFKDINGNQMAFVILIPCYLIILYFAVSGHKVGLKKN